MLLRPYTFIIFMAVNTLMFLLSCENSKSGEYEKETKIFGNYLSNTFHQALATDSTNYFLFSDSGCPGCMKRSSRYYQKNWPRNKYIMSPTLHENNFSLFEENIMIDSTGTINRLKYNGGNIGIIQVANKQVYRIIYVEASTIDSIYAHL